MLKNTCRRLKRLPPKIIDVTDFIELFTLSLMASVTILLIFLVTVVYLTKEKEISSLVIRVNLMEKHIEKLQQQAFTPPVNVKFGTIYHEQDMVYIHNLSKMIRDDHKKEEEVKNRRKGDN